MPKRQHEEQLAKKGSPVTAAQIEAMAKKVIERRVPGTGGEVALPLRITLTRAHWEALSAAAIRKGVNLGRQTGARHRPLRRRGVEPAGRTHFLGGGGHGAEAAQRGVWLAPSSNANPAART
jgi:hypothetical protein